MKLEHLYGPDVLQGGAIFGYSGKVAAIPDRTLEKTKASLDRDARVSSRGILANQRIVARRSHSVQVSFGEPRAKSARPDTPIKPHACLYGEQNKFRHRVTSQRSDNLGLVVVGPTAGARLRTPQGRQEDELMRGVRNEARRSLRQMEGAVIGPKKAGEQGGSWAGLRRENRREVKNRAADRILADNIGSWHRNFVRKHSPPTSSPVPAPARSMSCDLPRIPADRVSLVSQKSEPCFPRRSIVLPTIE